ncbi:hypothetical protein [Luethyella okanaganae]|uniref:ABC transporter permease n=1 Tax=Luethyella okanaganae TaxID=69372 RepID=A0ABW1VFL7_9MICO
MVALADKRSWAGRPRLAQDIARESRLILRWPVVVVAVAVWVGPLILGIVDARGGVYRDNLDFFGDLMNSPVSLVFPLLVVLVGCFRLFEELGHRAIVNTRMRSSVRATIATRLTASMLVAFGVFFIAVLAQAVLAFAIWPLLGNPSVDPSVYRMGQSDLAADQLERFGLSQAMAGGPIVYSLLMATWIGFGAAVYAAVGTAALVTLNNRFVALLTPMFVYFGLTLFTSLLQLPHFAPMFSLFPIGLTQQPVAVTVAPTVVVAVVVACCWILVMHGLTRNARLG